MTVGEPGEGLSGWRFSHRQAKAALPVAERRGQAVVRYADVALLASILRDDLLATSLRQLYLEPLERARDGGKVARETLRAYFAAERNISSTAAALGVDRRTVTNRIRAIEDLFGRPLRDFARSSRSPCGWTPDPALSRFAEYRVGETPYWGGGGRACRRGSARSISRAGGRSMRKRLIHTIAIATGLALIVGCERLGQTGGGPGRQPLPQRQRRHHAVDAAPARAGADLGHPQRPDRHRRRHHPPAIAGVVADFDKSIQVNAKGLPTCREDQLGRAPARTRRRPAPTRSSAPGRPRSRSASPNRRRSSAKGPILLFNGGVHGGTTLLFIHTYVNVPAPTAVIATVKMTHIHRGHYGIHVVAADPGDRRRRRLGHQIQTHRRPQTSPTRARSRAT